MLIGELYLEFPDKLLTVLVLYALIHLSRHFRNRRRKYRAYPVKELSVILAAGICAAATAPAHILTAEAAEESIAYIQTVYNGENGLLCGHANAIAETSDGILWIGTYAGLYRYNGAVFAHMDGMDAVRNVNCLYTDDEGRLWGGTNDNGAAIVINEEIVASVNSQSGLPSDSIRSIEQSENGDYYIGTSAGLVTVRLEMGISVLAEIEDTGYVSCLSADHEGNVTAVNSEGRLFLIRSGHNRDMTDVAPTASLISARTDWSPYLIAAAEAILSDGRIENFAGASVHGNDAGGGFAEGWVSLFQLNEAAVPSDCDALLCETVQALKEGKV